MNMIALRRQLTPTAMFQPVSQPKLYDQDFVAWCDQTVAQLKARQLDRLDWEALIEEIEGLANRDRKESESRLDVLLSHLLKRIYVASAYDYRGWENTIRKQRRQLQLLLKHSPSLKSYVAEVFGDAWQYALSDVKANYPQVTFPEQWPFSRSIESLLTVEFWQEHPTTDRQD